jgi:hypothetical protein
MRGSYIVSNIRMMGVYCGTFRREVKGKLIVGSDPRSLAVGESK